MKLLSLFTALALLVGASTASAVQVSIKNSNGRYVSATGGGGSSIFANTGRAGGWAVFDLIDTNGGNFNNGDPVCLKTSGGYFVTAEGGGASVLNANRVTCSLWEKFTIYSLNETGHTMIGPIKFPARVVIRSSRGFYVSVERDGRGSMTATRTSYGPWEIFNLNRFK